MQTIECGGAPRDQGLDQGAACAPAIRAWLGQRGLTRRRRFLPDFRRLTSGASLGAGVGREVVRHYPHLAERMSGLARASGVALDALMEDVVASAYGVPGHPLGAASVGLAAGLAGEPVLARSLGGEPAVEASWVLRRSRPEVGFASVELVAPWLVGAVVGVNESGLGAAICSDVAAPRNAGRVAPPPWLLVQECLQRFDELDGALEWCLKRPCDGEASVVLADASGDRAVVEIADASRREVLQRGVPSCVAGGPPAEREDARRRLDGTGSATAVLGDAAAVVSLAERRIDVAGASLTLD